MAKYNLPSLPRIGDPRGIGDYKSVGDWAESRGGGTLQALANLFNIGGDIAQKSHQQKQEEAYRKVLLDMVRDQTGDYTSTEGTGADEFQQDITKDMDSMLSKYKDVGTSGLLNILAQKKAESSRKEVEPQELKDAKFVYSQLQAKDIAGMLSDKERADLDFAKSKFRNYGVIPTEQQAEKIATGQPERYPETAQKQLQKSIELKYRGNPSSKTYTEKDWMAYMGYQDGDRNAKAEYRKYLKLRSGK